MKCPFCAETIADEAIKCKHCGSVIDKEKVAQVNHRMGGTSDSASSDVQGLPEFYRNAFSKIDANNGKFTVIFNWASFLFGGLWYLYKGMWVKGLVYLAALFIFAGLPAPLLWIYTAIAGTYDYYLFKVKQKQLW